LFAIALAIPATHAQERTSTVSPALEVQRLAPQLVAFAGGDGNFANLVNGLALGVPVTLTTPPGAAGGAQSVTFTPVGTMTSLQIAQLLESARQSLIARGVATPTAQQLGATLAGGPLVTATGTTAVNGLVSTTTTPAAAAAGATAPAGQSPAVAIQNATSAAGGTTTGARNTSDSPFPRGISDTPPLPVPGVSAPVQGTATTGTEARIAAPIPAPAATGGTEPGGGFGQAGR
jgi:hypothetical protein